MSTGLMVTRHIFNKHFSSTVFRNNHFVIPCYFNSQSFKCNFNRTISIRLMTTVKLKVPTFHQPKTFQDTIFKYLTNSEHFEKRIQKLIEECKTNANQFVYIDSFFTKFDESTGKQLHAVELNPNLLSILPAYIFCMKERKVSRQIVNSCDLYCAKILKFNHANSHNLAASDLLQAWLNYFHPQYHRLQELVCYGKLIQRRGREVLQTQDMLSLHIVELVHLAGIGKRRLFESHEVLGQLAVLFDLNPEFTYMHRNSFELAIICESFFKCGIRMESEKFLSHISTVLNKLLSTISRKESEDFNPFVVISLLKILRQVNYLEEKVLVSLGKLVLRVENEKKVRNIGFLTNIVSAFVGPGRIHPILEDPDSELSVVKILNRIEHLVVDIIRDEEKILSTTKDTTSSVGKENPSEEVDSSMKSRLKDISRWLWATASLGFKISPEAYQADLNRRFNSGEILTRPGDAVDALLALAIMNHYLDGIVMKVLHSSDFRSALREKCSKRHKGRFGLFLTSLKIERNDLWRQLSPKDVIQWMETVGIPLSETQGWSSQHLQVKLSKDKKMFVSAGRDYVPHTQLLNQCMDALNSIFASSKQEGENKYTFNKYSGDYNKNNNITTNPSLLLNYLYERKQNKTLLRVTDPHDESFLFNQVQIRQGYAVPYFHIPGIKIILPATGKELYLEVFDDLGVSPSLQQFKLRLMAQTKYTAIKITRKEIEECPNLDEYLKLNIIKRMVDL